LIPSVFDGTPEPLKIVLTTVVVTRPAAFEVVFGAAIAEGISANVVAIVIAISDLLPFMKHLISIGELSLNLRN
jgi:hypothetical protein